MGFVGTNDWTQFQKPTGLGPAESDAAASAAPGGSPGRTVTRRDSQEKAAIPSGIARIVAPASIARNTSSVRPPMRLIAPTFDVDATPVITSDTTNGMIVMRIAFTHNVPAGATASTTRTSVLLWLAAIARPRTSPAPRPTRTRLLSFISVPALTSRAPEPNAL